VNTTAEVGAFLQRCVQPALVQCGSQFTYRQAMSVGSAWEVVGGRKQMQLAFTKSSIPATETLRLPLLLLLN